MLREFTKMGHRVAGFGRRSEKIKELANELNIDVSEHPYLLQTLDITDVEQVQIWCKNILSAYGAPNLLIHNAGSVVGCNKNTWALDMDLLQQSYDIHVKGGIVLCKCLVPAMMSSSTAECPSNIIMISSWAGKNGYAEGTPYVTSKFAIEGLVQCMSQELEDTVL